MSCSKAKNEPLISVIVPIYKIERYVGMCIESIIKQTYRNIEIILVDDGSPDRCPEICDLYAKKDSRIMVIHKENGGLVSARKAGIEVARGEYVGYVDGDDWIDKDFYKSLLMEMIHNNADLVVAGQSRDLFAQSVKLKNNISAGIYEGEKLEKLYREMISYGKFYKVGVSTYVWNKLFKRDMLKKYQLSVDNKITIGEDAAVVYPLLLSCKKICIINNYDYHYRQREDSMLKKSSSYKQEADNLKLLYNYMSKSLENNDSKYRLQNQVDDFILGMFLIRSGCMIDNIKEEFLPYKYNLSNKNIAIYSAGTFGQQLVKRISDEGHCNIVGWYDDDYWEYRRCCLDVDPTEEINNKEFDYVLIATINNEHARKIKNRLIKLGVNKEKILEFQCDERIKQKLLDVYLKI